MRKIILCLVATLFAANLWSQTIKYQAVVRDNSGTIKVNKGISLKFELVKDTVSSSPTVYFNETHNITTNSYGMVNLEIGSINSASFNTIDWSQAPYYLKISLDNVKIGATLLTSVPYAFFSNSSDYNNLINKPIGTNVGDMLYWNGTQWIEIPKGSAGQVLSLTAAGTPAWSSPISVSVLPPSVRSNPVNITNGVATISGVINPNGFFTESVLEIEGKMPLNIFPTNVTGGVDIPFAIPLNNIKANTTYQYTIKTKNAVGETITAKESFTTPTTMKAYIENVNVASIGTSFATIGCSISDNNSLTSVYVEYGLTTSYGSTVATNPSFVNGNTTLNILASISGLAIGTTYHYRVKAINDLGSTYSGDMTFTTSILTEGWYVIGGGVAVTDFNGNTELAKMAIGKNEMVQVERPQLHDIFMAVKAGSEGFNIIHSGSKGVVTLGPDAVALVLEADRTSDEPKVDFQRGTVKETNTKFTVPTDGLYHIAYDEEYNTIVIVPVYMGIIGGATPGGWSASTPMTSSAFNLTSMTFTINDLSLDNGDFKYRYSDGWKVIISDNNIRLNSNFGGTIDNIFLGGYQLTNSVPGIYTTTMTWTIGSGWTASLVKTGELVYSNDWSATKVEFVGDAIDGTQAGATDDASGWNWGNLLFADDSGLPVVGISGTDYTYTWTTVITVAGGCRIRTAGGVASGGINFDAGYAILDVANSTTDVANDGGNLKFTAAGSYRAVLTVDAANADTKVLTITKL